MVPRKTQKKYVERDEAMKILKGEEVKAEIIEYIRGLSMNCYEDAMILQRLYKAYKAIKATYSK